MKVYNENGTNKFTLKGKVTKRFSEIVKKRDGTSYTNYNIVIEDSDTKESKYPSRFQLSSKLPSLFGQKDGPCGEGKHVVAEGFVNSSEWTRQTSEGKSKTSCFVRFVLSALTTDPAANAAGGDAPAPQESSGTGAIGADGVADDIPF